MKIKSPKWAPYLFVAPFPWQLRGALDIIALISNVLLIALLWKFITNIQLKSIWQIYLLVIVIMFTLLLSFMTGNVGLILRQKTILLPFVFLLLFSDAQQNELKNITRGNNLPKRRNYSF